MTTPEPERSGATISQLIQTIGAAVALAVALSTAGYTLYQKFYTEPREKIEINKNEFTDSLSKFATIQQTAQVQSATATNPQEKANIISSSFFPMMSSMFAAEKAAGANGFTATATEYTQIANDEQILSRWEQVIEFSRKALNSNPSIFEAASSHDMIGKALAQWKGSNAIEQARTEMALSIKSLDTANPWGSSLTRAMYLRDWAIMEGLWGNCGLFAKVDKQLLAELRKPDVPSGTSIAMIDDPSLYNAMRRCPQPGLSLSMSSPTTPVDPIEQSNGPTVSDLPDPDLAEQRKAGQVIVTVQDILGKDQNSEGVTLSVNGERTGYLHVSRTSSQSANIRVPAKVGDAYQLQGYISETENGQRVRRSVYGSGHFMKPIAETYHLQAGSRSTNSQVEFLMRGPSKSN